MKEKTLRSPGGSGSRPTDEAAGASSPKASIPNAGDDLRIAAFVTQGLGLGGPDERLRRKAAGHIRKAADILDLVGKREAERFTQGTDHA